jgi:hypothetical protein
MSNDHWIQDAHIKEGALTAQAKRHGMKPLEFARYVIENPDHFSGTTKRRANFALNIQVRKGGDKVIGMSGGAIPESRETLGDIAQSTYKPQGERMIKGWSNVFTSPTIKAYKKNNNVIIAVRGTNISDKVDLGADASIPLNNLKNTPRYLTDVALVNQVRQMFPTATFYAVGHSLGGAIVDNLINDGLVSEGLSFNPAIESKFYNDTRNARISHTDDPLYAIMGKNSKGTTVITDKPIQQQKLVKTGISWLDDLANKAIDYTGVSKYTNWLTKKKKAHSIGAIFGRGKCGKDEGECQCSSAFKTQLESNGYSCDKYLKDARAVAKKAGYDPKMLGFSMDTKHKLQILTPDGKVRRFGAVDYGDFLIWKHFERIKKVPKGYAKEKQHTFHASHEKMRGKWKDDKYSPNSLALAILW